VVDREGRKTVEHTPRLNHWTPKSAYVEQLMYVNTHVEKGIKSILAKSKNPPIIILQSDHGPVAEIQNWNHPSKTGLKERMSNFAAFYIPGAQTDKIIPDTVTPVNIFRLIFNHVFGTHYSLLPDLYYFTNDASPTKLVQIRLDEPA